MRKVSTWLIVVTLAVALAACQGAGGTGAPPSAVTSAPPPSGESTGEPSAEPVAEPETRQVTIGYTTPDFAQIIPFKWFDDLEAAGYELEIVEFESGTVLNRAMIADQVDLALGSVLSVIQLAQETGGGARIIASDNTSPDYIMLAPSSISSVTELTGKRLGISGPGDISDVLSKLALSRSGVDPANVEIVQIGGTNARIAGLVAGQIDAGIAHAAEAYSALEEHPDLRDILSIGEIVPDLMQRGLLTTDEFIQANPVLTQILVDGFIDATRWAADNKAEYIALSEEHVEGLSDAIRDRAYDTFIEIEMFGVNGGISDEALENVLALNKEIGVLEDDAPGIDVWADNSFAEDYLARNGER